MSIGRKDQVKHNSIVYDVGLLPIALNDICSDRHEPDIVELSDG